MIGRPTLAQMPGEHGGFAVVHFWVGDRPFNRSLGFIPRSWTLISAEEPEPPLVMPIGANLQTYLTHARRADEEQKKTAAAGDRKLRRRTE
jgi:hypothetical protein